MRYNCVIRTRMARQFTKLIVKFWFFPDYYRDVISPDRVVQRCDSGLAETAVHLICRQTEKKPSPVL